MIWSASAHEHASSPYVRRPSSPEKKNWLVLGCGGCLGLIVIGAIIFGIISYVGVQKMKKLKDSPAFEMALKAVEDSAAVQEKIGTPMTAGSTIGALSETGDTGKGGFYFPITGPKGTARVIYAGEKTAGAWTTTQLTVAIDGSKDTPIQLVPAPGTPAPPAP